MPIASVLHLPAGSGLSGSILSTLITLPGFLLPLAIASTLLATFALLILAYFKSRSEKHQLDRLLNDRTRALVQANDEMHQALQSAKRAAATKGSFLARMSHEIRTPINSVLGLTSMLLETPLTKDQRGFTETIQVSADALLEIVNDVLDFSKIEAGKLSFERVPFGLRKLLNTIPPMFAHRLREKGIALDSVVAADVPDTLLGDPGRLRQVLLNLVGNAVKFTSSGMVKLEVSTNLLMNESATLCFTVTDTGIGIEKDKCAQLFEDFVQGDVSIARQYGGTGLGLAICRELVQMMDGAIEVESEVGNGARFWFTARFDIGAEALLAEPVLETGLEGKRVLIVDDSEVNRQVLYQHVTSWGMLATNAVDGVRALKCLHDAAGRNEPFEIVLLDLEMPGMDGLELARNVKADARIAQATLLLLPSQGVRGQVELARDAGIHAYLSKPVRVAQLYECLLKLQPQFADQTATLPEHSVLTRHDLGADGKHPAGRILLAEDNETNQMVTRYHLTKLGYEVDVVNNGRDAVALATERPFDLILMDCQMPIMDGFEATTAIRGLTDPLRNMPIVALTASTMADEHARCMAVSMNDFLSKPYRVPELQAIVERWVAPVNERENSAHNAALEASIESDVSLDTTVLDDLRDLDDPAGSQVFDELLEIFLTEAPMRIEELHSALAQRDQDALSYAAHKLKGSSGCYGARRLMHLCRHLEELVQAGKLGDAGALISAIEREFNHVRALLMSQASGQANLS